jgi:hypothetical protein
MVENKYFMLDLVWYITIYATYLDETQVRYIEDNFAETEENDYDVVVHEDILYPFEIYNIPIEKYDEVIKYFDDNGFIQKDTKYTKDEVIAILEEEWGSNDESDDDT